MSNVRELIRLIGALLFTFILAFSSAEAQASSDAFGGFSALKGLIGIPQKDSQSNKWKRKTSEKAEVAEAPETSPYPQNATEYCKLIKSNPMVKEYVDVLAKAVEKSATRIDPDVRELVNQRLDDEKGTLREWVKNAPVPSDVGTIRNYSRIFIDWASVCAAENYDNNFFLFFVDDLGNGERVKQLREKAEEAITAFHKVTTSTKLDASGRPVVVQEPSPTKLDFDLRYENESFGLNRPSLWVTLTAFALANGTTAVGNTGKGAAQALSEKIDVAVVENEKRTLQKLAEQKEKDKVEAQQLAAEQRRKDEFEKSQNSPNGLLLQSYEAFQAVQACFDARKGYALLYVNDVELSAAKDKMSRIDSTLKLKISGTTTNQIWAIAAANNSKFIKGLQIYPVQNNRAACDAWKKEMADLAEKILGKEILKKTF